MFQQRLNDLRVHLTITPVDAVLVKDGRHQEHGQKARLFLHREVQRTPPRPRKRDGSGFGSYGNPDDCFDMAFVHSRTPAGDRFYLPGSSLRGVLRHTAEQVIGRWRPDWARASDPFANAAQQWFLQQRDQDTRASKHARLDGAAIYRQAGPLERCFGHTALRGRWTIADAWMDHDQHAHVQVRDGVGISRATGAAQEDVKFQYETITGGNFHTVLTLVNYELWQPGLLAMVLAALDRGEARLGYGTRRGLGHVRVAVTKMEWRWYGTTPAQHDGMIQVPPLADLAHHLGDYGWCDTGQRLRLELTSMQEALLGSVWSCQPACLRDTNGNLHTKWDEPLWQKVAVVLEPVLRTWSAPAYQEEGA